MATNPTLTDQPIVCRYNKFGFCRFRGECRKQHVNDLCVSSECDVSNCEKRHPRKCKFHKYKKCKFGEECKFDHSVEQIAVVMNDDKLDELERKVSEKNEVISKQSNMISELEIKHSKLEEQVSEKNDIIEDLLIRMQAMENRMIKAMDDKEAQLNQLLTRTEQLENKFNDLEEAFAEKVDETPHICHPIFSF